MTSLPCFPELLIFDLDGTLIDSIGDISEAVNEFRRSRSATEHDLDTVRSAVGHGARELCRQVLSDIALPGETEEDLYQAFRKTYIQQASSPSHTLQWLPGAPQLLAFLQKNTIQASILTNKPREVTAVLRPRLESAFPWCHIICPEDAGVAKPDPSGLLNILKMEQTRVESAVFVGDSAVDFATGRAAGIYTVGLKGGYGKITPPEPDQWIEDLSQLTVMLTESKRR